MRRSTWLLIAAALVAALVLPSAAAAKKKRRALWYEYSVPFACGTNAVLDGLVPGDYAFTLLLSNGSAATVATQQQLAVTSPPGAGVPGPVSETVALELGPGEAVQYSCADLLGGVFLFMDPPDTSGVVQGVARITSHAPLVVTGTQSVATAGGAVSISEATVVEMREGAPPAEPNQVTICHRPPGNPGNAHTLTVGAPSWPAHQGHGDSMGACPAQ